MTSLKRYIKRGLKYILFGTPVIHVKPNIVSLSNIELLNNHSVLVTGGTSGIGYAIAKACLQAGANVVITSRNEQRVHKTVESLKKETQCENVYGIALDLNQPASFRECIEEANLLLLPHKLDLLVNNAGIMSADNENEIRDFELVLKSNLEGTYFLSNIFADYMIQNKLTGHILNVASVSALRPAITPYMLSKWGIRGMTLGLAKKYVNSGITVNGIAPGPTVTPMINRSMDDISHPRNPMGRIATPEEVASMAIILLSSIGDTVVGDIVYMGGGAGVITFDDVDY